MRVRRSSQPAPLEDFFPPWLHDDLARIKRRCWQKGIAPEQIAGPLRHYVNVAHALEKLAGVRAKQGEKTRQLQTQFRDMLIAVRREYDYARRRGRVVRSPLEQYVRAILVHLARAERVREGRSTAPIDLSDPMLPWTSHPGPRGLTATRQTFEAMGIGRRDITWLLREARSPTALVSSTR